MKLTAILLLFFVLPVMSLEQFEIEIDNHEAVHYPGQVVSGRVVLVTDSPKVVRGINVRILGKGEVNWQRWTESKTIRDNRDCNFYHDCWHYPYYDGYSGYTARTQVLGNDDTDVCHYTEELWAVEIYIEKTAPVFGGRAEQTIPAGQHSWPFEFVLPKNVPSSFEGEYGNVRYYIRAFMDKTWRFDQETSAKFKVLNPVDLNKIPGLKDSVANTKEHSFWCIWCTPGPVKVTLSLPLGGAVPGQVLLATVFVENNSSVFLETIQLDLVQTVTYKSRFEIKTTQNVIFWKTVGFVDAEDSKNLEWPLRIPELPPSNFPHCNIIDVQYRLHAYLNPSSLFHFRSSFGLRIPLTVGTIPLSDRTSSSSLRSLAESISSS